MRMKEAQTLGILFLIAVGIIVLCMWGGGPTTDAAGSGDLDSLSREGSVDPLDQADDRGPSVAESRDVLPGRGGEDAGIRDAGERYYPGRAYVDIEPTVDTGIINVTNRDQTPEPPRAPRYHIVSRGDTLSTISDHYYNTCRYAKKLAEVNKVDPRRLQVKMRLRIPYLDELTEDATDSAAHAENTTPPTVVVPLAAGTARYYTVKKGDSWWSIAEREMGNGSHYKKLQVANKSVLKGSDVLQPNMKLRIPAN